MGVSTSYTRTPDRPISPSVTGTNTQQRRSEAGTALLITLFLIVALLGGGATFLSMQLTSSKSAGVVKQKITSQACAEAGLVAGRSAVASNYPLWSVSFCTSSCVVGSASSEPTFLRSPLVDHDLDNNGTSDFVLTLVDNNDEVAPEANNPEVDNDLQAWLVSTCTMGDITTSARELVKFMPGGTCYANQLGGCGGTGNSN